MSSFVQVIDQISHQILFETHIENVDLAYQKTQEYEEMGLDIKVLVPGVTESLIKSLGASEEEIENYRNGLNEEINSHNEEFGDEFGCAVCPPSKNIF